MENERTRTQVLQELMEELNALRSEVDQLRKERNNFRPIGKIAEDDPKSVIHREDKPPEGGGYIVKTPRPWSGERMGIQFRNGIGIIDGGRPDCEALAHWMEADYHYEVISADADEILEVRRLLDGVPATAGKKKPSIAEKLVQPNIVR